MKSKLLLGWLALLLAGCLEGPDKNDDQHQGGGGPPPAPIQDNGIPISAKEACILRWPGEFAIQAKDFCNTHLETDRGDQMDEKLYPNVRPVATEDELIAALAEDIPYKRIILTKSIILKQVAKFIGPAVIEGPQMLIFEKEGLIRGNELPAGPELPNCRIPEHGIRTIHSFGVKLRVSADTRDFKFDQPKGPYSSTEIRHDQIVLEGRHSGRVTMPTWHVFLVVVNTEIEVIEKTNLNELVLINASLKINVNDADGSRVHESLAASSRIADPFGGELQFMHCWDKSTVEKTEISANQKWPSYLASYYCERWQQLIQNWAQCGVAK